MKIFFIKQILKLKKFKNYFIIVIIIIMCSKIMDNKKAPNIGALF